MITLACPFIKRSKTIHKLWLISLNNLEIDRSQFRLVMLDLAADQEITNMMKAGIGDGWAEVVYLDNPNMPYGIVSDSVGSSHPDFFTKRKTVAATMQQLNENRIGDMLLYEDDIIVQPDTFKIMQEYLSIPNVLGVTGVNYSRNMKFNYLLMWDWKDGKPVPRKIESEHKSGFEFIGSSATGFTYYKKEFLDSYVFLAQETWGQDIRAGKYINEMGKLLLIWDLKYPHLGVVDNKLVIYRSNMCKTEVRDEHGTAL